MTIENLNQSFVDIFKYTPGATYFAPGRINLIGEHIDYNGGLVFPCAITNGTYAAVGKREDQLFRLYSANFESLGIIEFTLDDLSYNTNHNWCNYVKGILQVLLNKGFQLPFGLDILVYGNIPNGAGLSSSASLEMLISKICSDLYELPLKPEEMALIGKEVENKYMGVNSGIMDQFAIALGKKDHALLLNCNTQNYQLIPFDLDTYSIVIMNTNKRRELADSKYNERFTQCQTALELLKPHFNINALCELKADQLEKVQPLLNDDVLYRRVRHVVTENQRVIEAKNALSDKDLVKFGELLNASHHSLKEDYEVTGLELDTLAESALNFGAIGARMTGAGFGGCGIALVKTCDTEDFISRLETHYNEVIGYKPSCYIASVGSGPIRLQ